MCRRLPPFRPHVLAACLLVSTAPAFAQGAPRSMAECERLKNDLAYNQCLAMFGPPARNVAGGGGYVSGSDPAPSTSSVASTATIPGIPSVEEPDVEPVGRKGRRGRHGRRHGRASASFDIGSAETGAGESESGSSRARRRRR
ncbi:MAG: hypothetical protein PGN25_13010 [Methylorubrum populi]